MPIHFADDLLLGAEMDLQLVENSVVAVENILKAWLHDQTGEREHLQLLLPASLQTNSPKPTPAHGPNPGDSLYTYTLLSITGDCITLILGECVCGCSVYQV